LLVLAFWVFHFETIGPLALFLGAEPFDGSSTLPQAADSRTAPMRDTRTLIFAIIGSSRKFALGRMLLSEAAPGQ